MTNTVDNSEKVVDFLKGKTRNTLHNYKSGLKNYIIWFNKQYPNEKFDNYIKDIRLMQPKEKLQVTDRYEKDIRNWYVGLKQNDYAPKTIAVMISSVRSFLIKNRIDLDKIFWNELNYTKPSRSAKAKIIVSTPKELKEILQHSPDTRAKSFFMILATSGLRLSELCDIKMNDIDIKYQCPRLTIRDPKNNVLAETRMSPEAKAVYLSYLKIRKEAIKTSYRRSKKLPLHKFDKDISKMGYEEQEAYFTEMADKEQRAFPFSDKNMEIVWNNMLKRSGYDEQDTICKINRYMRNIHTLRKYFQSNFGQYSDPLADYLTNHISEMTKIYNKKSAEWIDQEYLNGCQYLAIFETPQDTSERLNGLHEEMAEKDKQIQELEKKIDDINQTMLMILARNEAERNKTKK